MGVKSQVDSSLSDYLREGVPPTVTTGKVLTQVCSMSTETVKDQVQLLASISNNHWWPYLDQHGLPTSHVGREFRDHVALPREEEYLCPGSLRNQVIQWKFLEHHPGKASKLHKTIMHVLQQDLLGISVMNPGPEEGKKKSKSTEPSKKTRKVGVTPRDIAEALGVDVAEEFGDEFGEGMQGGGGISGSFNVADQERDLFDIFSETLCSEGTVLWRETSPCRDYVVMSGYCASTGVMQPTQFVHIVCDKESDGHTSISCTCRSFEILELAARRKQGNYGPLILDESVTCMHILFYRKYLQSVDFATLTGEVPNYLVSVQDYMDKLGDKVIHLGNFLGVAKFSVLGSSHMHRNRYSFVHLTKYQGDYWAKCLCGSCKATKYQNKKKIILSLPLEVEATASLCPHLTTLIQELDLVRSNCEYLLDSVENPDPPNIDPVPAGGEVWFDTEEGVWKAQKVISEQGTLDMYDDSLVSQTFERLQVFRETNLISSGLLKGFFKGPPLQPSGVHSDCSTCGMPPNPTLAYQLKVYSRQVSTSAIVNFECFTSIACNRVLHTFAIESFIMQSSVRNVLSHYR